MVAFAHSIGGVALSGDDADIKSILNIIANGGMGVTLFFILSGFVLKRSLDQNRSRFLYGNAVFLWKRFLRIWPAMFVSVTFCAVWANCFYTPSPSPIVSIDYKIIWAAPIELTQWVKDLLFMGNRSNLVTWTLQVEMVAALFMLSFVRIKQKSETLLFLVLIVWLLYFFYFPMYSHAKVGFSFIFILGMYVGDIAEIMSKHMNTKQTKAVFFISFFLCGIVNYIIPGDHKVVWFLMAIIAMINIASLVALHKKDKCGIGLLNTRLFKYMGKVSFSFYLWHLPVLLIIATLAFNYLPSELIKDHPNLFGLILFVLSTLATLPVSHLSYQHIEARFLALSKKV